MSSHKNKIDAIQKALQVNHPPCTAIFMLFLVNAPIAYAVTAENVIDLGTTVVSATRSDRLAIDAPIKVEVVSKKTLEKNHVRTLKDALEQVPGLQFRRLHGKTGYEVLMQGLSGDRVLVLIDGMPISASTGSTVNLNQYSNLVIERIEIIKGAASAQYGSAAMGGVINVITQNIAPKMTGALNIMAGTHGKQNANGKPFSANTKNINAEFSGSLAALSGQVKEQVTDMADIRFRLAANLLDNAGISQNPDDWPRIEDASKQTQYKLDLGWYPQVNNTHTTKKSAKKPSLWLSADYYTEDDESRYNRFVPPRTLPQKRQEDISRKRLNAGGNWQIATHTLKAEALHERYQSESELSVSGISTQIRRAKLGTNMLSLQWDMPATSTQQVQLGVVRKEEKLSQHKNGVTEIQGGGASSLAWELYAQHSWFMTDDWELLSGIRTQHDDKFGWHYSPKVAVRGELAQIGNWTHSLRASVGTGYRVPNLKDRYFLFDHSNLGYTVTGNANLKPETSVSYQLGLHTHMNDKAQLDASVFYNQLDNLIQTSGTPKVENGIANYTYENVAKAHTYGAEISSQWQAADSLALKTAYTYTKTKNESSNQPLVRRPKHIGKFGVVWQVIPQFELLANARWQSKELVNVTSNSYSPAWTLVDLKANYQAMPKVGVYAGVNNIFNRQRNFSDQNDVAPVAGREVYVGSKLHW